MFDLTVTPWVDRIEFGDCWLWQGVKNHQGYGRYGASKLAHRLVYETVVGPIPPGLELDHLCRVHACVNPDHLEPVTHRENMRRGLTGIASGAKQRAKTHCPAGHALSDPNVYRTTEGKRQCRTCHRDRMRQRRASARSERVAA